MIFYLEVIVVFVGELRGSCRRVRILIRRELSFSVSLVLVI